MIVVRIIKADLSSAVETSRACGAFLRKNSERLIHRYFLTVIKRGDFGMLQDSEADPQELFLFYEAIP